MKQKALLSLIFICTMLVATTRSQTNLLLNPNADLGAENWRSHGEATVEEFGGNEVFVVRNGGSFLQEIDLTESDAGKFALFIGRGSSERINADGAITGLPYLYGYMLSVKNPKGGSINAYLQGQMMRCGTQKKDEWVPMFGVFRVPDKTVAISFFLNQAERRYVPQNGSAARFDNLGLYLFESEADALAYAKAYR